MKKIILLFLMLPLLFAACTKITEQDSEVTGKSLVLNLTISHDQDTKGTWSGWHNGDVIEIFFDKTRATEGSYYHNFLSIRYSGGSWTVQGWVGIDPDDLSDRGSGTLSALYVPYHSAGKIGGTDLRNAVNLDYFAGNPVPTRQYSFFLEALNVPYTADGGVLTASITMRSPAEYDFVSFFVPNTWLNNAENGRYTLVSDPPLYGLAITHYDPSADKFVGKGHPAMFGYQSDDAMDFGILFTGWLDPDLTYSDVPFSFYLTDTHCTPEIGDDQVYTYSTGAKTLTRGKSIRLPQLSSWNGPYTSQYWAPAGMEAIAMCADDRGNTIYFSNMNLGATSVMTAPSCFGSYYQWGVPNTSGYEWEDYPFSAAPFDGTRFNKYVWANTPSYWGGVGTPDNKSELDPIDDPASVELAAGRYWRSPNESELLHLLYDCDWSYDAVNKGWTVTGRGTFSANSIFLPLLNGDPITYWSSSLIPGAPWRAISLSLTTSIKMIDSAQDRNRQYFIRPVYVNDSNL